MSVPGGSCPQCGATIGPGVHFCPRCGTGIPLPEGARATVAAPPGAPPEDGRNVPLDALGYAHRHGVIHRDVKSANIMLDEDGWAVVTDFGIAKVVQAEGLTLTGVTVGTPTYMSPEQCDMRDVTGASDQYSLGVVAYEMITGHLPFKGDSTMSVMYAHFNEPPRPVTELRPDCPPNLGAGVMRMLEKDPSRRWPSMDDVVAVCGRPSLRHDDPVRREMITLAKAGASAHLLAQLNTPTSPIVLSRAHSRRTAARSRARRVPKAWWGVVGAAAVAAGLWWLAPWRGGRPATTPTSPVSAAPPAASLWAEAERVSRSRPPAAIPPAAPPPVTHPPADPRVEIKALIGDYARALESRDLAEIRRVYPGLTSAEQATFAQFFESVSDLKAGLTINRLIIAGSSADAFVSGVYEYRDTRTGRGRRDTTSFRATLVQDSTGWHLSAIRSLR